MKLLSLLLASVAAATPLAPRATSTPDHKSFYLKTADASNADFNDLYVYAYHTGAGLNDAVLTDDKGTAKPAYLNGNTTQFDLGSITYNLNLVPANNYAWQNVEINVGQGSEGFFINGTGLEQESNTGFGGWLVCDWNHNAPQLFWLYQFYQPKIPSSCSKVNLKVEYTA